MEELKLNGKDHIKLCDLLAVLQWCENAGVAKNIIATGVVTVDDQVELRKRAKILAGQRVQYLGKQARVS